MTHIYISASHLSLQQWACIFIGLLDKFTWISHEQLKCDKSQTILYCILLLFFSQTNKQTNKNDPSSCIFHILLTNDTHAENLADFPNSPLSSHIQYYQILSVLPPKFQTDLSSLSLLPLPQFIY